LIQIKTRGKVTFVMKQSGKTVRYISDRKPTKLVTLCW